MDAVVDPGEFTRDFPGIAHQYAEDVVAGKIVACRLLIKVCRRHLRDLDSQGAFYWDDWHGSDVCAFLEALPHVEGDWASPTIILEDWQIFITCSIFAWRRRADGLRRFNTVYFEVGRKNAKTTWAAGIALYCGTCEGENGPQIKTAANTGSQARLVFDIAKAMVERLPDFQAEFQVEPLANSIVLNESHGHIRPINAKASTQDGLNPHLAVFDELHAAPDRRLFDVLRSARGARKNPLSLYITTAGDDTTSVCYEQRLLAEKILDLVIEADHFFAAIFTLDPATDEGADDADDWTDERNWVKANPGFGTIVNAQEMRDYCKEAKASPATAAEFKKKRLNIWLGASAAWLNMETWKGQERGPDLEEVVAGKCFGGLDLAAVSDMNALVWVWFPGDWLVLKCRFYVPEAQVLARSKQGDVPYKAWQDAGVLTVTPGDVTDYAYIEKDVEAGLDEYQVEGIAYDPWNAYDLVNRLIEKEAPMIEFRQGAISYNLPMKFWERKLKQHRLAHQANAILTWMASNAVARRDVNRNLALDRKNAKGKIDGIAAGVMATGLGLKKTEPDETYDQRIFAV